MSNKEPADYSWRLEIAWRAGPDINSMALQRLRDNDLSNRIRRREAARRKAQQPQQEETEE